MTNSPEPLGALYAVKEKMKQPVEAPLLGSYVNTMLLKKRLG